MGRVRRPVNDFNDHLKRVTITALFSDDQLLNTLVLKGGNALNLVHNLKSRASFDLDFSMEGSFAANEIDGLRDRISKRLSQAFAPEKLVVFDVEFGPRPERVSPELQIFWGGYLLAFKVISLQRFEALRGNLDAIRREAMPAQPGGRVRFQVDISKYEFCHGKQAVEINHFTVYAYTPSMIVCEKIRAICQQTPEYAKIVKRDHRTPRARDFFDICETVSQHKLDLLDEQHISLIRNMFAAKRVPAGLLRQIESHREFHREDWKAVEETVAPDVRLRSFDHYFDHAVKLFIGIADLLGA